MSLLYSAGKWNVPPAIAGYEPIGIFLSQGIFPSSRETARCPPCQVAAPYSQYSTGGPSHYYYYYYYYYSYSNYYLLLQATTTTESYVTKSQ